MVLVVCVVGSGLWCRGWLGFKGSNNGPLNVSPFIQLAAFTVALVAHMGCCYPPPPPPVEVTNRSLDTCGFDIDDGRPSRGPPYYTSKMCFRESISVL